MIGLISLLVALPKKLLIYPNEECKIGGPIASSSHDARQHSQQNEISEFLSQLAVRHIVTYPQKYRMNRKILFREKSSVVFQRHITSKESWTPHFSKKIFSVNVIPKHDGIINYTRRPGATSTFSAHQACWRNFLKGWRQLFEKCLKILRQSF